MDFHSKLEKLASTIAAEITDLATSETAAPKTAGARVLVTQYHNTDTGMAMGDEGPGQSSSHDSASTEELFSTDSVSTAGERERLDIGALRRAAVADVDAEMRANACRLLTTLRFAALRRFHAVVILLRGPLVIGTLLLVGMTLFALADDGVPVPRYVAFIPTLGAVAGVQLQLLIRVGRASCFPRAQDRANPPPCLQRAQRAVTRGGIFVFHALVVVFIALEAFPFGASFAVRAIPLYIGVCAMLLWIVAMCGLFVARIVGAARDGEQSWQEPAVKMALWLCSWGHIWLCFLVPQVSVLYVPLHFTRIMLTI
jgi:hypothetical protein